MLLAGEEEIPHADLEHRRRILLLMIYAFNIPLFLGKAYELYMETTQGTPVSSSVLILDIVLTLSLFGVITYVPSKLPVFPSSYRYTEEGIKVSRLLKKQRMIPYDSIRKVEIYEKIKRGKGVSKKAIRFARESITELEKVGFKLRDYSNDDDCITVLHSEDEVYLLSPSNQKVFAKRLTKKAAQTNIRVIELTEKGKRERAF